MNTITLGDFSITAENPQLNGNSTTCSTVSMNQPVFRHMIQSALVTFWQIEKLCLKHLKHLKAVYHTIIN